jgi:hypothetical protein
VERRALRKGRFPCDSLPCTRLTHPILFCAVQVFEEEIGTVKGHFGPINTVAFHPDGKG